MDEAPESEGSANALFLFRKGRSCVMNLVYFYSRVLGIIQEKYGWADGVYVFRSGKKTFDKVLHMSWLWKIESIG